MLIQLVPGCTGVQACYTSLINQHSDHSGAFDSLCMPLSGHLLSFVPPTRQFTSRCMHGVCSARVAGEVLLSSGHGPTSRSTPTPNPREVYRRRLVFVWRAWTETEDFLLACCWICGPKADSVVATIKFVEAMSKTPTLTKTALRE